MLADPTFFQFFDFDLKMGDRVTALVAPDKCVIIQSWRTASENPVNSIKTE